MTTHTTPWHFGMKHARQQLDWLPCDDQKYYEINMNNPEFAEYIRQQGWDLPGAISYNINRHGFRSAEFGFSKNNFIALGCSFTIGIGLPLKDIWPTLIGNATGLTTCNLGWGGNSADTCYRLAEYWVKALMPKLVVFLAPPPARIELALDDVNYPYKVFMPANETDSNIKHDSFLKNWFLQNENAEINNRKNKLAIQSLCDNLKIKFLCYDVFDFMSRSREEVKFARDYMHAGPPAHQNLTNQILRDLA